MRFTRKDAGAAEDDTNEPGSRLRSELNRVELVAIGLAAVVGAGIFVAAPEVFVGYAGPLIIWSFALAAVLCVPVALCYAECSSRIPVAGSAYTFSYVAFGRPFAWLLGWLLVMEYAIGAAVVAKGWSGYLRDLIAGAPTEEPNPDWGAAAVVVLLALVLSVGVTTASKVTLVATGAKLGALLLIIAVGIPLFDATNLTLDTQDGASRIVGNTPPFQDIFFAVVVGTGVLFYAFIAFDSVSTMAEEARRPRRDLPQAILATLGIATVLYLAVALVMAAGSAEGVKPDTVRAEGQRLTTIFATDRGSVVFQLVSMGAVVGLTTGILVLMLAQSRIAFAMTRDGFLPRRLAKLGWSRNPQQIVLYTGAVSAVFAAFGSTDALRPVVNLGTLVVYAVVCRAARTLQVRAVPAKVGSFRVPAVRFVAMAGMLLSIVLAGFVVHDSLQKPEATVGLVWFGIATVMYGVVSALVHLYGRWAGWRSRLPAGLVAWLVRRWPQWRYPVQDPADRLAASDRNGSSGLDALVERQRVMPVHRLSGLLSSRPRRRLRAALTPAEERALEEPAVIELDVVVLDTHLVLTGLRDGDIPARVEEETAGRILAVAAHTAGMMRRWAAAQPAGRNRARCRRQVRRTLRRVVVLPGRDTLSAAYSRLLHEMGSDGHSTAPLPPADFAWTAASAIAYGLPVAVADPSLRSRWPNVTFVPATPTTDGTNE